MKSEGYVSIKCGLPVLNVAQQNLIIIQRDTKIDSVQVKAMQLPLLMDYGYQTIQDKMLVQTLTDCPP